MNKLTIDDLLNLVKSYNPDEVEIIKRAYYYADNLHTGQKRQSGEPYITHPLNVAYILAEMHADRDTVCAGLLHDTLEDTHITKEDISHDFNPEIAALVDGVTKISKLNFSTKQEQNVANTRKIITGITSDVRIIIIKLADRLHNMRTMEYKSEFKQKENSLETMDIFVPLAYYIGAYRIKSELEDLSFRYLKPDIYMNLFEKNKKIEEENKNLLLEMKYKIENILKDNNIPNEIKVRTKNIYGIYRKMKKGFTLDEMHDLVALKVVVSQVMDCYKSLGLIHSKYHPLNYKFKDYISSPKTNMYQSLHTSIFGPFNRLIQCQIRTFEMDKANSYGLTGYWDKDDRNVKDNMLTDLKTHYQFFNTICDLNDEYPDNKEFIEHIQKELFSNIIYVFDENGNAIELAKGSTIIDFAYKTKRDFVNVVLGAYVNNNLVGPNYILTNNDRVSLLYNKNKSLSLKK